MPRPRQFPELIPIAELARRVAILEGNQRAATGSVGGSDFRTDIGPDLADFWEMLVVDLGDSLVIQQWDDSASAFLERFEIVGKGTGLTNPGDMIFYDRDGVEVFRYDFSNNNVGFQVDAYAVAGKVLAAETFRSLGGPDAGDQWVWQEVSSGDGFMLRQWDASAGVFRDRFQVIGKGTTVTDEGDWIFYDLNGVEIFRFDESTDRVQFATGRGRIDFAGGASVLSSIEKILSFGADITIQAESTGATSQDLRLEADDAAGVMRTRMHIEGAGDHSFLEVDGTTVSALWDESESRWKYAARPYSTADAALLEVEGHTHGGSGASHFEFVEIGTLTKKLGDIRWYPPFDIEITDVSIGVGTQPTGRSIIVDVNKNGGASIFTTQANRPEIAVSTNFDVSGTPDVIAFTKDTDYVTMDIDEIGSTVPGANMTIQIRYDVV